VPTVPSETGVGLRSAFAITTLDGILGAGPDGRILGRIATLPPGTQAAGLALQPDGKRLYFALTENGPPPIGFGSDIYSVNIDGTDLRPVVKRDQPNVFYATPVFDSKGTLYVHRRQGDVSGANINAFQEVKDMIERVDVATGEHHVVIRDGADPTVSADGTQIIYMKFDRGQATDLWIAATDGTNARKFLKTDDWFSYLQSPRFSPNSKDVMWSSVPPIQIKRTRGPSHDPTMSRTTSGGRLAHLNIPSELFIAPIDGSSIRSIFTTSDDIVPAWSADGARIAFVLRSTFYILSAANGKVLTEATNIPVAFGDVVWLKSS
jgi:Tol biopolymer transport system component